MKQVHEVSHLYTEVGSENMATKMMLQCVLEGSISVHDMEVEHRPYHRNCSCAMHKVKDSCSNDACSHQLNISFPRKQPRSCGWLNTTEQRRLECTISCKVHKHRELRLLSTAQQEEKRGNHGTKACHIYLTESSDQDDFLSTLYSFF